MGGWDTNSYNLLELYNIELHWDQSGYLLKKYITILNSVFKTKVHENYIIDGRKSVHTFTALTSFLLFKFDFHMEPYLHCVTVFKLRRSLRQLHSSSHTLAIEKGRHCKPQIVVENNSLSVYCDSSELQLMLICPFYLDEHIHFYPGF